MITEPIKLDAWIEHRADGDFAICFCPQPKGREHLAYTACWADAGPDEFGGMDFCTGASVDAAITALTAKFPGEAWA